MTLRDKIAERLRTTYTHVDYCVDAYQSRGRSCPDCQGCWAHELADEMAEWGDIFCKTAPSIEDVQEEAKRVFGGGLDFMLAMNGVAIYTPARWGNEGWVCQLQAPTIAAAYAALRALPTKEDK